MSCMLLAELWDVLDSAQQTTFTSASLDVVLAQELHIFPSHLTQMPYLAD